MHPDICARRREALRPRLAELGLSALLVSHAANRFYLSGFELKDAQCNESSGWLVVGADGQDWLLTDPRYEEEAKRHWDPARLFIYTAPKAQEIRGFLKGLGCTALGFDPAGLCYQSWRDLSQELPLTSAQGLVEELRLFKDAEELAAMRRSLALNQAVFDALPQRLIPGKTEAQLAWEVEELHRTQGASELSFSTIVGVGANAALPHARPGDTRVRENDLVLVDCGCRLDDYCSDQTRTFWVGDKPSARFQRVMDQVREAQDTAIKGLRPGMSGAQVYALARQAFEQHGTEKEFTHALGHGIGLETHEPPSLGPRTERTLAPGMVVTIEPGLYYPDWGGIRWEYMVLVTEDGCELL